MSVSSIPSIPEPIAEPRFHTVPNAAVAHAKLAKDLGAKLVISTDAHSTNELQLLRFGLGVTRRAWLTREDVLNTLSVDRLLLLDKVAGARTAPSTSLQPQGGDKWVRRFSDSLRYGIRGSPARTRSPPAS